MIHFKIVSVFLWLELEMKIMIFFCSRIYKSNVKHLQASISPLFKLVHQICTKMDSNVIPFIYFSHLSN